MPDPSTTIVPLSPERLPDFLAFFEGEAFADNPKWGSCYCQFLHVDHNIVHWHSRTGPENRGMACQRISSGRMQGYLAYRDGQAQPIAWCNAGPRALMASFDDEPDPDAAHIGQIGCFVVAKPHRRTGVATQLLQAACAGLKAQGLRIVEATPITDAQSDAQNHFGPLSMFLATGFSLHRTDDDGHSIVRRVL